MVKERFGDKWPPSQSNSLIFVLESLYFQLLFQKFDNRGKQSFFLFFLLPPQMADHGGIRPLSSC